MHRVERCISRTPELIDVLDAFRLPKGWSLDELGKQAKIGAGTIYRIYHPEDPKGVSGESFAKVATVLTDDPRQRVHLLRLAGIALVETDVNSPFIQKMDEAVEALDLNPASKALLQEFVLQQIQVVGGALKQAQSAHGQLQESLSLQHPRRIRKLAS